MKVSTGAVICALFLLFGGGTSYAKPHHHTQVSHHVVKAHPKAQKRRWVRVAHHRASHRHWRVSSARRPIYGRGPDYRPRAWCGWAVRQWLGVADRAYNLARNWAHYGSPASGPAPGVIAVWPHHVGIVVSVPGPGRIVLKSGNDGHAVRIRERSTRGVIAWRYGGQRLAWGNVSNSEE